MLKAVAVAVAVAATAARVVGRGIVGIVAVIRVLVTQLALPAKASPKAMRPIMTARPFEIMA